MKGDKQKYKFVSLIIIIVIGIVGMSFAVFSIINNAYLEYETSESSKKDEGENVGEDNSGNNEEIVKLTNDDFSILMPWAKEIYECQKYLNFPLNSQGIYYLTFDGLENLGYDVSKLDVSCKPDTNIMFFDLSRLFVGDNEYPVLFNSECTKN